MITALYADGGLDLGDIARHVGHVGTATTAEYVRSLGTRPRDTRNAPPTSSTRHCEETLRTEPARSVVRRHVLAHSVGLDDPQLPCHVGCFERTNQSVDKHVEIVASVTVANPQDRDSVR